MRFSWAPLSSSAPWCVDAASCSVFVSWSLTHTHVHIFRSAEQTRVKIWNKWAFITGLYLEVGGLQNIFLHVFSSCCLFPVFRNKLGFPASQKTAAWPAVEMKKTIMREKIWGSNDPFEGTFFWYFLFDFMFCFSQKKFLICSDNNKNAIERKMKKKP